MTTKTKAKPAQGAERPEDKVSNILKEKVGKQPLQLTHDQMKVSLSRDLDTLAALLNFIRSTPAVVDLIAEYAVGIQNNILNKAQSKPDQ